MAENVRVTTARIKVYEADFFGVVGTQLLGQVFHVGNKRQGKSLFSRLKQLVNSWKTDEATTAVGFGVDSHGNRVIIEVIAPPDPAPVHEDNHQPAVTE